MNAKNKRTSGILIGSMLIGGILLSGALLLPLIISDKTIEQETKIGGIVIYSFIALLFTMIGIYSSVKGLTAYKSMSRGRKRLSNLSIPKSIPSVKKLPWNTVGNLAINVDISSQLTSPVRTN